MADHASPPLSRLQLEQILGLAADPAYQGASASAQRAALHRAGLALLGRLAARSESAGAQDATGAEKETIAAQSLDAEQAALLVSIAHWTGEDRPPSPLSPAPAPAKSQLVKWPRSDAGRRLVLFAAGLFLGSVLGWAMTSALRIEAPSPDDEMDAASAKAKTTAMLVVMSRPEKAELRIRDAESEELLVRETGETDPIELPAGAYEIEVSRSDCPDHWLKAITLEPGESRRYEATICQGAGELVVRSNVREDRVRIDAFDVGSTRTAPHLLGVGDHVVRVTKGGYAPFEATVRIRPGGRTELRADLTRLASSVPERPPSRPASSPVSGKPKPDAAESSTAKSAEAPSAVPALPSPRAPRPSILPFDLPKVSQAQSGAEALRNGVGGSTTWHDRVSAQMIARFDADDSGSIDRASETKAVPCTFWKEIERSFDQGGLGISMVRLYGFDGSEWHPQALGFSQDQREAAHEQMRSCGLAE